MPDSGPVTYALFLYTTHAPMRSPPITNPNSVIVSIRLLSIKKTTNSCLCKRATLVLGFIEGGGL